MVDSPVRQLVLDRLDTDIPTLSKGKAFMLMEACTWCLMECGHHNGVRIIASGIPGDDSYGVFWSDERFEHDKIQMSYDLEEAVEHGAEALSLLLVLDRTRYSMIRRSLKKTGVDYWLGLPASDPNLIFSKDDARLEISGILRESPSNTIKSRVKQKLKQTKPTDHTFPVYVVVVEFGRPCAQMELKDVNGSRTSPYGNGSG